MAAFKLSIKVESDDPECDKEYVQSLARAVDALLQLHSWGYTDNEFQASIKIDGKQYHTN